MKIPPSTLEDCFFYSCVCVYLCSYACTYTHMNIHMNMCLCSYIVDVRSWYLVFFFIAFHFIYWYRVSHFTWCSPIQAVELACPRDIINQLIKFIYYIFYIPTKISPFSSPLISFPTSPMCFSSIYFSSVPVQKVGSLPTKHGKANCSKTKYCHLY